MISVTQVFVFGSNKAGRHGAGAAKHARVVHKAVYGVGSGPTGNSYAIPTKDWDLFTLSIPSIKTGVDEFLEYARVNPDVEFQVTAIGCGFAGYSEDDIKVLFSSVPSNCNLPERW